VETVESQTTGFPPFPRTLGNRKGGDFHIPTASATAAFSRQNPKNKGPRWGPWKSGNPNSGFSLFHRPDLPAAQGKKSGLIVGKNG
jgi:hypothetical protein